MWGKQEARNAPPAFVCSVIVTVLGLLMIGDDCVMFLTANGTTIKRGCVALATPNKSTTAAKVAQKTSHWQPEAEHLHLSTASRNFAGAILCA